MKSFTTLREMGRSGLADLIDEAARLRELLDDGSPIPRSLEGRCVANMFFEPSTRTRLSFDLAAQKLGAHVITLDPDSSSASKGESLRDTSLTIAGIGAEMLVVRHSEAGVPQEVANWTGLPVINAGDGIGEHPTQALLDAVTLHLRHGALDGLRVAIVGDIRHSRVAGSLVHALPTLGANVTLVAPAHWLPDDPPLPVTSSLDDIIEELDVLYLLRVQTERGGVIDDAYIDGYQLDVTRASRLPEDAVVMHAGPLNRGVEVSDEVAESPRSLIAEQVRNGVPTRMAIFNALAEGRE